MPTKKKLRQKQTKEIRKAFISAGFACTIPQASKIRAALKKSMMHGFAEIGAKIFPEGLVNKFTGEKFIPVSEWNCGDIQCCVLHGACVKSTFSKHVVKIFTNFID